MCYISPLQTRFDATVLVNQVSYNTEFADIKFLKNKAGKLLCEESLFLRVRNQIISEEMIMNGIKIDYVAGAPEFMYRHKVTHYTSDTMIWENVGESIIDLNSPLGLREATERLLFVVSAAISQPDGKGNILSTNHQGNIFGRFLTQDNEQVTLLVRWSSEVKKWCFVGWYSHVRYSEMMVLSKYSSV